VCPKDRGAVTREGCGLALEGPTARFYVPIPDDAALVGFELSTQALHFGGVLPFALSNALDLFLGY